MGAAFSILECRYERIGCAIWRPNHPLHRLTLNEPPTKNYTPSAKSALRYNRIGYGEIDKAEAVLYINTHGVNTGSLCAMDEEVQILDRIETVSPKGGKKMVAMKVY